jgi:hypothetical protein
MVYIGVESPAVIARMIDAVQELRGNVARLREISQAAETIADAAIAIRLADWLEALVVRMELLGIDNQSLAEIDPIVLGLVISPRAGRLAGATDGC